MIIDYTGSVTSISKREEIMDVSLLNGNTWGGAFSVSATMLETCDLQCSMVLMLY